MRKLFKGPNDVDRIKELSFLLGFENSRRESYAVMRKRGGSLYLRGCNSSLENKASSLSEWNGWIPLQNIPLNPGAISNKARVIAEVNADILLLQEIEERGSLLDFNMKLLYGHDRVPYQDLLVLQGNDDRGRELAILTKNGFKVEEIRSFMDERTVVGELLFDTNLLQYKVSTPSKKTFWLIAVHFVDTGRDTESAANMRFLQSSRVAEIYQEMWDDGKENIIIAGTLNEVCYSHYLSPLLQKTDLKDITKHPEFNVDIDLGIDADYYRMGAYRKGVNIKQKDYLLLSPEMFKRAIKGGLNRKAVWPDKFGKWNVYDTIGSKEQAASEHPVIWAEIDI
ncbi:hypothetical protein FHG64_17695 [Antarcticibacterium flavum]|uniref:Endonuclease/exonuclease/phosphatase family protein n=1 Tax=Antarcticibacterium flavum TaxID=2058175 RepID=A0A5B7X8U9_9FLAO|nr:MULTISPECIES: hypothetical protein [Antarcticibacterium]QCY71083.1 hypothetical protein FHG64_17695 [Antarcticibacterium flavum]